MPGTPTRSEAGFLPDFCRMQTLFVVVISAELLVFVLVLAQPPGANRWQLLGLYSLYVQWVALGCSVVLCLARAWLMRWPAAVAGVLAWLVVVLITAAVAWPAASLVAPPGATTDWGFVLRSAGIAALVAAVVLRYLYLQQDWRRRVERASGARVQALQARIRPHFLFNSLNTIAALVRSRPERAEEAVEDLADLFRASLEAGAELVTVADELSLAEGYLRMERLRLGERLVVDWDVADLPRDALVPPLTLQPLLENAIYHGVEPRPDGGTVVIRGTRQGEAWSVCLSNPESASADATRSGFGMAVANVRERLELAFGDAAQFRVSHEAGSYTVCMDVPLRRDTIPGKGSKHAYPGGG